MTSIRIELDQLAHRFTLPVRALASLVRLLDPLLSSSSARRVIKAGVDFSCGAAAAVIAAAVGERTGTWGMEASVTLALLVGRLGVAREEGGRRRRPNWGSH